MLLLPGLFLRAALASPLAAETGPLADTRVIAASLGVTTVVYTGMTDAMLVWQTQRFQELAVSTDGTTVQVRPEQVVEIAFSDVQVSPRYPSGMALRLARVKRYRDDKTAAQADSNETVRGILDGRTPKSRAR